MRFAAVGCVLWCGLAVGTARAAQRERVVAEIEGLEAAGARVGMAVVDLPGGAVRFEHGARAPLLPASNQKLVTLVAALTYFGGEHRFATTFHLRDGVLVVAGSGDPNWRTGGEHDPATIFGQVADALRARGIHAVRGVRVERGSFGDEQRPDGWSDYDPAQAWCPPTGPLVLDAGCFEALVEPAGARARVLVLAPPYEPPIEGAIAVTQDQRRGSVYGMAATPRGLRAFGALWAKAGARRVRGAVTDGLAVCEQVLARGLARAGIAVDPGSPAEDAEDLHSHRSPLCAALTPMMKDSSNFHAEQLARALGAASCGDGSFAGARAAIAAQVRGLVGDWPELVIDDGSGLSRRNRLSAAFLATLLAAAAAQEWGELFVASLPEGGEGTLRRRLRDPAELRVRAKTGTLRDACALSGYLDLPGGVRRAFVILVNLDRGRPAPGRWRAAQDRIVAAAGAL